MSTPIDDLLPFYANGTLSAAERERVERHLREHPEDAEALRWIESLQARVREDVPPVSSEVGLERALQRVHREGPVPQRARPAAQPSPWARLGGWLARIVPQAVLRPALAASMAVVAAQAGVILVMATQGGEEATQIRSAPASVTEHGPYLKLNFKADAREADMRLLLVQAQGSLVAGPSQLGDYYVRVPATQAEALATRLKANPIIDSVAVVDALPSRP